MLLLLLVLFCGNVSSQEFNTTCLGQGGILSGGGGGGTYIGYGTIHYDTIPALIFVCDTSEIDYHIRYSSRHGNMFPISCIKGFMLNTHPVEYFYEDKKPLDTYLYVHSATPYQVIKKPGLYYYQGLPWTGGSYGIAN